MSHCSCPPDQTGSLIRTFFASAHFKLSSKEDTAMQPLPFLFKHNDRVSIQCKLACPSTPVCGLVQ
eukprot:1160583-Pelagomonas_calceolata.AAC.2